MIALARCLVAASVAILAACDSSPDPSPNVVDPARLTVLPATATLYSGLPTTFVLSGGTGSYIVTSSNQAVIAIAGNVLTKSFVVIPSPVTAETPVTLTVRDTGTAPLVSATLTVRPGTVANSITITPTPSTDPTNNPDCRPAVCTGSDAEVSVVIAQGGVPLAARGVRFEVITGDFRFITTPAGVTEVLGLTVTTTTDETGRARARFRATALAPTQTATLRIVDVGSGAYQQSSFTIAQFTGNAAVFFASPSSVTFTGPRTGTCASSGAAQFTVYGGVPPYVITGTSSVFSASPLTLASSGSTFNINVLSATCTTGNVFSIADASGRVIAVTAASEPGTEDAPALVASPSTLTLTRCADRASISVAGGVGGVNFIPRANANTGSLSVTAGQNVVTVERVRNTTPPLPVPPSVTSPAIVSITDGVTTAQVVVSFSGTAAGVCLPTDP